MPFNYLNDPCREQSTGEPDGQIDVDRNRQGHGMVDGGRVMSAYMKHHQARADAILAQFAAGVNHAYTRNAQVKAVIGIANEVERHANAIDPREVTAVSVLVDLVAELAQAVRHIANIMDADDHPAPIVMDYPVEGPEWPASLLGPEVTP